MTLDGEGRVSRGDFRTMIVNRTPDPLLGLGRTVRLHSGRKQWPKHAACTYAPGAASVSIGRTRASFGTRATSGYLRQFGVTFQW